MNKNVEKLIVFVMNAMINTKKSNQQEITLIMNNNFIIEDFIIKKVDSIEENDDFAFIILVTFTTFFAFGIALIFTIFSASTFFASRVVINSTIFRFMRKKHEFILKNNDSFLKSRNINFVMREIINEKMIYNQNSNKSRREAAIQNNVLRKNNFKHFI